MQQLYQEARSRKRIFTDVKWPQMPFFLRQSLTDHVFLFF